MPSAVSTLKWVKYDLQFVLTNINEEIVNDEKYVHKSTE